MKTTIEELLYKYKLLKEFNILMKEKKYINKDLLYTIAQEKILYELYKIESFNILNSLLLKTHYRLLKQINKGMENLIDVINNSSDWTLNLITNDLTAWISDKVLIFTTEASQILVFSHISRNTLLNKKGFEFINNKWK